MSTGDKDVANTVLEHKTNSSILPNNLQSTLSSRNCDNGELKNFCGEEDSLPGSEAQIYEQMSRSQSRTPTDLDSVRFASTNEAEDRSSTKSRSGSAEDDSNGRVGKARTELPGSQTSIPTRIFNIPGSSRSSSGVPPDDVSSSDSHRNYDEEESQTGDGGALMNTSDKPSQDAKSGETQNSEKTAVPTLPNTRLVWAASLIILSCYIVVAMTTPTLSTQYLNYRIGKDDYNFSYSTGDKSTDCGNSTSEQKDLLNRIQRETSRVVITTNLASGIPSVLTCLVVGSYSDFLGRRPLIIASVLGAMARASSLAAVIYFDLSVGYFYLGSFVDGVLGSYFTLVLAVTAVIADVTPVPEARALRFAIVEGTLFTAGAVAELAIGFMIKTWDYFVPSAVNTCLIVVALIVTLFCLPETMTRDNKAHFRWNPTLHMRKVFGFYFIKAPGRRRSLYILGLCVFLFLVATSLGRPIVETLYFLNSPICWNSIDIGVFQSLRLVR
ncbi:proton-coupled folate transporter [Elysia marginata]|uniref:Proton-coupled folate transporter n=1 Tax=Elysia marginata TaxID=1093978 RepID=A0AAV4JKW2_9GAST|nr:proton-coupled folate transporter [Elysia marginata]